MSADPENLVAIFVMALAAMCAKGGGYIAMRWFGRHHFVMAWLDNAPGAVIVSAAAVPLVENGSAFVAGAVAAVLWTRLSGFTAGLFAAVAAVALARYAGLS